MDKYIETRRDYIKSFFKNINDKEINKYINFEYVSPSKRLTKSDYEYLSKVIAGKLSVKQLLQLHDNRYSILDILLILSNYCYLPKNILFKNSNSQNDEKQKYFIYFNKTINLIVVSFRGMYFSSNTTIGIKFFRTETSIMDNDEKNDFFTWRENQRSKKSLKNFTFPLEEDKDIEIHKGFQDYAKDLYPSVKKSILKIIKNMDASKTNIIFTGHSLGGATAFIMSIYFAKLFKKMDIHIKRHVITFSSPPIGNKNFHLLYYYFNNSYYVRVANNGDYACSMGTEGFYFTKKIRHINMLTKDVCILKDVTKTKSTKESHLFYVDTNSLLDKKIKSIVKDNPQIVVNFYKVYHSFFCFNKKSKLMFL